ncbi:MAG: tetratricopeptide repeat protein, partial [Elusimicrobiota bacterium]
MNRIISLIIGLAGLIIVFLTSLTAEEDKVKTAVLDTVAADSMSWSIPSEVVGRLEVEYEMLQIIVRELSRLKNACEVLRDYQIYPERLTKLNKQRMLNTDKKIEKSEDAIKGFEGEIKVIRRTLEDAIAMTNELISEEPDADMFHTIRDENIQRVKQILEIKHMINNQWDYLMTIIDDLLSYNDVVFEEKLDLKGFDEEFFKLLNATLGKSSENFYKRLNRLKEILIVKAKNEEIKDISQIEIQRVKQRIRAGNYDIAQIQLKSLVRLLQNRITLNTIYYLLGQVQFALGEYNEALKCYKAVEKSSAYYINSRIGLYQTLFRQGEYPTIIDDYEKTPLNIKNSEFHNLLCYFVSESYYRLGNFDKVMTVSNQAKNLIPYYEPNLFILGQTYVKKGDYELAQAIFKKIATNEPQSKTDEAVKTKSKIAMAHLFFLKGRYQEALSQYLSAIDNPEFFSEALYGIAWCYIKTENLQNSELSLKYLINQSPNDLWGAKAMLDLALNFSKRASLEWSYKIALDEDK